MTRPGAGLLHHVLLHRGVATGFSSDESSEEVLAASMLGAGISGIFPTVITLSFSEDTSEQSVGGPAPQIFDIQNILRASNSGNTPNLVFVHTSPMGDLYPHLVVQFENSPPLVRCRC